MPYKLSKDGTTQLVGRQQLRLGNTAFKRTDDGSEPMDINGALPAAAESVWNGTGDAGEDWSTSGEGSEEAAAAHSGSTGWDSGICGANTDTTFNHGSELDVAGTFSTLSFWLQPKAYPGNAVLQLQWKNAVGTVIGSTLNVENYVTNMDLDVWQQVTVPIADFNLTADVQKLVVKYKVGTQRHWLDDIELLGSGGGAGPFIYEVAPGIATENYHVSMIVLILAAPDSGWAATAFGNIAGGLDNGVLMRHRKKSTSEVLWSFNTKDNADLFGRFHPQDDVTFSDGTMLIGFMIKPGLASVVLTTDEVLEVVIRDDLSSLTSMRGFVHYGVEDVT